MLKAAKRESLQIGESFIDAQTDVRRTSFQTPVVLIKGRLIATSSRPHHGQCFRAMRRREPHILAADLSANFAATSLPLPLSFAEQGASR